MVRKFAKICSILKSIFVASLRIQCKCRKIRTRKTPNTDTFHAVHVFPQRNTLQCCNTQYNSIDTKSVNYKHPVLVPRCGLFNSQLKIAKFQKLSWWDVGVNFPPWSKEYRSGIIWISNEVNWQVYCDDLKLYLLGWPKNTEVTFKWQNILWNIWLNSNEYLKIESETQYTNHQIHNAIKNQIFQR